MQLGFVGTGTMGAPIAGCLIDAGHRLTVYDIRSEATGALAARGAAVAANPRAVAEASEAIFTSLPGPDEMEPTVLNPATGILAGLRAGCGYIDLTTNAPAVARRVGEACRVNGVDMLDAPVSGRPPGMTVMVGGDEAVFVRYRPLFEAIARNIFYVGAAGAGCIAKLVTQYLGYTNFIAALEGLLIGAKAGVDPGVLAQIVPFSAGASRTFDNIPRSVLSGAFTAGGTLDIVAKDLHLACELAREVAAPGSLGLLAHDVFHRAQAQGWGQDGFPVAARILEAMAGRELRSQTGRNAVSYQAEESETRRTLMSVARESGYRPGLVDLATGQISREIFVNEEIYREEQERLFARAWLFVGHETQIPNPGDFFVSGMGEESVILCRDRAGEIHVFLNSCRHRGMKVCRYDEGNTPVFTCPYHGWSYGTDGKLVGVPYFREAYHSTLDRSQWGLVEVAQLCNYKGAIWATWDPAAPSFTEYLGNFARYLDLILDGRDGREGQAEVLGGVQKWLIPCNWKFPAENFSGDSYHNISHRSVDLAGIGPSGAGRRDMSELLLGRKLHVAIPDRGHQTIVYALPKDLPPPATYQHSPVVSEYFRYCEEERRRTRGDEARLLGAPGEIFPNIALLPRQPRTIAVWHPRGAHQTEVWRWFLVDREAPQEVKDFLRDYYIRYSGPAGMTEQDDMENWNYAHQASRGTIARRHPYSYEMGLGTAVENFEWDGLRLPGRVIDITKAQSSEEPMRNLYARWAQFMEADNWDDLATWRQPSAGIAQAAE